MPHSMGSEELGKWMGKLTKGGTQTVVVVATIGVEEDEVCMRLAMPPEFRNVSEGLWEYFWEQMRAAAEKLRETPMDDLNWV